MNIRQEFPINGKKNMCGGKLFTPIKSHDDFYMTFIANLRNPLIKYQRPLRKSREEKELLKKAKANSSGLSNKVIFDYNKREVSKGKLTVYVDNTKHEKDFKTTHSYECYKSDVNDILLSLKNKGLVVKNNYFRYV